MARKTKEENTLLHKLEQDTKRLAVVLHDSTDAIIILNTDGVINTWNHGAEKMYGYSAAEALGMNIDKITPPGKLAELQEYLRHLIAGHSMPSFETQRIAKNGSIIDIWQTVTKIPEEPMDCLVSTSKEKVNPFGLAIFERDITLRKQLEAELKTEKELFLNIYKNLNEQIFYYDVEANNQFRLRSANSQYLKTIGIEAKDAFGKTINEIIPELYLSPMLSHLHQAVKDRKQVRWEDCITFPGGITLNMDVAINPVINGQGVCIGLVGTLYDITEKKRAEKELRESEQSYRNQFANNSAAMLLIDPSNGAIIDANTAALNFYGYSRKQLLTMSIPDIDPLSASEILQDMDSIKKTLGKRFQPQHRLANGSLRDVEVSVSRIQFGGRDVLHVIIQDITAQKQAEKTIISERERLALTLRSIGEGVIATNNDGLITMFNKAAETLTGWASDEVMGKYFSTFFIIVDESSREPCENPIETTLRIAANVEHHNTIVLISKDKTEKPISLISSPLYGSESKIIGCVLFFVDMSHERNFNNSIMRAQKLESLGVLAGGIAHDFNNMLSGVFGYLEMAKTSLEVNKTDICMDSIEKASGIFERAKGLTQQLLTFSSGGAPKRMPMQLKPLIEKNARFVLSGSNVLCQFDIPTSLWLCDVDENQFGQVIDNVVINAMQSMCMGGTIVIYAKNVVVDSKRKMIAQTQNNFVCITIKDTGMGMSKELLLKIFDPFFSTKTTGHGLGLATVYSIIKRHNGWIEVESEPGKGTRFHIFLQASEKTEFKHVESAPIQHTGTGTILVMDDEVYIREILAAMLTSMGYTVKLAKNSEEALVIVKESLVPMLSIDAVILDLTIPGGIGGKDTLIKMLELDPNIKAIASSGYSNDPVMAIPKDFGFKAKLQKPFSKKDVEQVLVNVLSPS